MLGTVERAKVRVLLDILSAGDGAALLDEIERIAGFAPDFAQVLDELAGLLHRVQLLQLIPDAAGEDDAALLGLAGRLASQDVQLWYQMAVTGRRDLALAPTPRVGFEMTLLRMLAFVPASAAGVAPGRTAPAASPSANSPLPERRRAQSAPESAAPVAPRETSPGPSRTPSAPANGHATAAEHGAADSAACAPTSDWSQLIERAELRGGVGQLARQASLVAIEGKLVRLALKAAHEHLAVAPLVAQLEQRLGTVLGANVKVKFERDNGGAESPADRHARNESSRRRAAEEAVRGDPVVQSLIETFDARVISGSVRPADAGPPET
jgi:DNA polymerase-3 subunit gamma/tau